MTISEASQLIMQAAVLGSGGEIYVLDMGKPVKITYLAEQLIRLSGKEPGRDIQIVYTGLRPGEKLFEELFHELEPYEHTQHEKIFLAHPRQADWGDLSKDLREAELAVRRYDTKKLKQILLRLVPELAATSISTKPGAAETEVVPINRPV
jgi:FlaA1/EpsC-like NDP-sugar epimerase